MKKQVTGQLSRTRGGFTLLELLIVLAIIVVIAAMVVPNLLGQRDTALRRTTQQTIKGVETACNMYNVDFNDFPESLDVLVQPQDVDGQKKVYLPDMPLDAWDRQLQYEWPNTKSQKEGVEKPAIWSSGKDGKNDDGEGDDINNWTPRQAKQ